MKISDITMNNGNPGIQVGGIVLHDIVVNEELKDGYEVDVYVEKGVQHPDPNEDPVAFEAWTRDHAMSAIHTKDDRIANRPNIWPDDTQHKDVYRAWHLDDVSISIWTTAAPKPPSSQ